jgi:hypothetical protein
MRLKVLITPGYDIATQFPMLRRKYKAHACSPRQQLLSNSHSLGWPRVGCASMGCSRRSELPRKCRQSPQRGMHVPHTKSLGVGLGIPHVDLWQKYSIVK